MDKTPGHQYTVRLPMDTDLQALRSTLHSPLGKRSRKLVRESRVYRVTANGQERSALVLSDLQPEEVHLRFVGDSIDWTCSCQDTAPCAHIVALLWQQADHGALSPTLASLFSEVQTQSNKPASSTTTGRKRNPARSEQELFLFDLDDLLSSTTANTPPQQPSLFDQAAETPPATDRPAVDQPAADQPAEPPLQASTPAQASATLPTATISPTANPPVGANTPLANTAPAHTHPAQEKKVHPWEVQRASPNAADAWAHLDILDLEPRFQIQFAETLGRTDIRLLVRYGDFTMSTSDKTPIYHIAGTNRGIRRNLNAETQFRRQLATKLSADLAWERGAYADLVGNDGPDWGLVIPLADFLLQTGRELMEQGFDILVMGRKILGTGALKVNAEHDLDWFGVNATIQLQEADPAARLAAGTMLHLMADQSIAPVPGLVSTKEGYVALSESDLRRLKFLRQHGMDANGQLHSSSVNLNLIDTLYDSLENRDDPVVQSSREALAEISTILQAAYSSVHAAQHDIDAEFDVPAQPAMLHARLRIYQLIGFAWLRSLHKYGYGACLADDMGLGKTMQTLALLCSLKEEGRLGPSLLITPVVTLSNWEAELRRFAPDLSFIRHQGTRRIQDAAHLRSHDLVIVSYQTLRNDLDLFAAHVWDCLILDEAHYIKSADSQIFKAVRVLSGKHRLSLTGTPIENNTMELHAQFSFLNPGLLGTAAEFQEQFAGPIERKGDPEAARALKDTVRPFILRRKKQDVLAELPDKNESVFWVDMDFRQAELYEAHRRTYQEIITGLLDSQGIEKSRMEVFKYLLRLRQLAIAPVLASPQWQDVKSAKLEALLLMLTDLVAEDNKVLIFSQFTRTLALIADQLESRQWRYALLTGATKDRQAEIDTFKADPLCRIFLLSLKAGGVGINLTQANYVVLFDPWWNPAAESQAIDRAYRMGQTRSVSAYKFITRNTIEEKILSLQVRKNNLSEALVTPGDTTLTRLDEETIRSLFA